MTDLVGLHVREDMMDRRIWAVLIGALVAGSAYAVGSDFSTADPGYSETAPTAGDPQSKSADAKDSFAKMDTNGDGVLSKQEAVGDLRLANDWDRLDSNDDGRIDRAEFALLQRAF